MNKQKALALITLIVVAGLLIHCWWDILFTDTAATWRQYLGLLLFLPVLYLHFKDYKKGLFATAIYLVLAICNILAFTPSITISSFGLNLVSLQLTTPGIQLLPLGLLILHFILNYNTFIVIYVAYKVKDEPTPEDNQ